MVINGLKSINAAKFQAMPIYNDALTAWRCNYKSYCKDWAAMLLQLGSCR